MAATGYIKNGKYYRTKQVPLDQLVTPQQSTWKQGDFARQRFDHAAEIIQPYLADGSPNPAMIEAWPEDAERYGFLPGSGELSAERIEAAKPAHGAKAWGE
jgi:hypothetical protein